MNSLAPPAAAVNLLAKYREHQAGWDLYADNQPITACANAEQRRGYGSATTGHQASIRVESVYANGGSAVDADSAIAGGW